MYKIIHIHNDVKFIDETAYFDNPLFNNEVVILGKKGAYKGQYKETALYLKPSKLNLDRLIRNCSNADMVVCYNLCLIKSFVANRLPAHVKIVWRFFGHELYRYDIDSMLSCLTQKMSKPAFFSLYNIRRRIGNIYSSLKNSIKSKSTIPNIIHDVEFEKALNRVDFFLWHHKQEYDSLKKIWHNLPKFMNIPTIVNCSGQGYSHKKGDKIILGNSRNPQNNHFDIINIFLSNKNFYKYKITIPFSYGKETNYSINLKNKVKNFDNIILSEDFLPLTEYELIFKNAAAFVINTFRQRALGNIFIALQNGVKIYLNEKNISYHVLLSQGFLVYSIDQLYEDLENNSIRLSIDDAKYNFDLFRQFNKENSIELFQHRIQSVLIKNKNRKTSKRK